MLGIIITVLTTISPYLHLLWAALSLSFCVWLGRVLDAIERKDIELRLCRELIRLDFKKDDKNV